MGSVNLKSDESLELRRLFNATEYSVFRITLPTEQDKKLNIAIGGEDITELETEESAAERQRGQGLKIMTPKQMITRLPILLSQVKAGNNNNKLKNEIRKIIYSLYRSRNLSKTIYNHLINAI